RIRKLLQPGVVRVAAVAHRDLFVQDARLAAGGLAARKPGERIPAECASRRAPRGVRDRAALNGLLPGFGRGAERLFPVFAEIFVPVPVSREPGEKALP